MSAKITNGYRLPSSLSLSNVMDWVHSVRPLLESAALSGVLQDVLFNAAARYDQQDLAAKGVVFVGSVAAEDEEGEGHRLKSAGPFQAQWYGLLSRAAADRQKQRRHFADVEANLTVFSHASGLYAMLFCSAGSVHEAFREIPGVSEFYFWNNSEPPEGIGEEEWESRKDRWDELLGESGVPAVNGVSVMLISERYLDLLPLQEVMRHDFLSVVPSLQKRALRAARSTPSAALPPKQQELLDKNPGRISILVGHFYDLEEGSVEGFNQERIRIESLLDPDLSWEKLNCPLSETSIPKAPSL